MSKELNKILMLIHFLNWLSHGSNKNLLLMVQFTLDFMFQVISLLLSNREALRKTEYDNHFTKCYYDTCNGSGH